MRISAVTGSALLTAALLLPASALVLRQSTSTAALVFRSCSLPDVVGPVLCGSFEVPEDRSGKGRTIALNIVVLKATGPSPVADPIVPLQGGPGQGAVGLAGFYARTLAALRESRDIVLIDVRGTGRSNPLDCDISSPESVRSGDLLPPPAIRACRQRLESRADLRFYTTDGRTANMSCSRGTATPWARRRRASPQS